MLIREDNPRGYSTVTDFCWLLRYQVLRSFLHGDVPEFQAMEVLIRLLTLNSYGIHKRLTL